MYEFYAEKDSFSLSSYHAFFFAAARKLFLSARANVRNMPNENNEDKYGVISRVRQSNREVATEDRRWTTEDQQNIVIPFRCVISHEKLLKIAEFMYTYLVFLPRQHYVLRNTYNKHTKLMLKSEKRRERMKGTNVLGSYATFIVVKLQNYHALPKYITPWKWQNICYFQVIWPKYCITFIKKVSTFLSTVIKFAGNWLCNIMWTWSSIRVRWARTHCVRRTFFEAHFRLLGSLN